MGLVLHRPRFGIGRTTLRESSFGNGGGAARDHDLHGLSRCSSLRGDPGVAVRLSLSRDAEIMARSPTRRAARCRFMLYRGLVSFLARLVTVPLAVPLLMLRLCRDRPDIAICAMPGPLDLVMAAALRLLGARLLVVVHEAEVHLSATRYPMQMTLQRLLCRCAGGLVSLSSHVGTQLKRQESYFFETGVDCSSASAVRFRSAAPSAPAWTAPSVVFWPPSTI